MTSSAFFSFSMSRNRIKWCCLRENSSCGVLDINNSTKITAKSDSPFGTKNYHCWGTCSFCWWRYLAEDPSKHSERLDKADELAVCSLWFSTCASWTEGGNTQKLWPRLKGNMERKHKRPTAAAKLLLYMSQWLKITFPKKKLILRVLPKRRRKENSYSMWCLLE